MNLLVIPSWYPHRCFPVEGLFIREQALAIGELRPEWKVALGLWAQGRGFFSMAHLRKSPRCLVESLLDRTPGVRRLRDNVVEVRQPALAWPDRVLHGNREGLLAANRSNLAAARRQLGEIDLIHAHVSYPAGWVAMNLSRETGIPFVVTEHQAPFPLAVYRTPDGSLRPTLREPLEAAAARIAVSPQLAARLAEFGIRDVEVVPNLVDERIFQPAGERRPDGFVFFTLASMEPRKGVRDLLAAITLFTSRLPAQERGRVSFRIGGDGPEWEDLRRTAGRLQIQDRVSWLGSLSREQAAREFQRCDCFVLASHQESFGIVFAEATASGKPVIGTPCGGPENIIDAANGILVDVGNPEKLAEAMEAMFRGADRYDAERIRREALARFGRAAVVDRLEEIYRRLITGPRRSARRESALGR